jgi:hypothetical protein
MSLIVSLHHHSPPPPSSLIMTTTDIHLRLLHQAHGMKFNPIDGFNQWKVKIESMFEVYGFSDIIEEEVIAQSSVSRASFGPTPTPIKPSKSSSSSSSSTVEQDKKKRSHTAFTFLLLCLLPEQMKLVQHINKGDAYGVWRVLLDHYERKTLVCRLNLRKTFSNIRMQPEESFDSYISRFKQIVLQLNDDGEQLSATTVLATLLHGLPDEYDQIVDTIGMNQNITFEEACSYIKDKQDKMKLKKQGTGTAYHVGDNNNNNKNKKLGYNNKGNGDLQNNDASSSNNKGNGDLQNNDASSSNNSQTNDAKYYYNNNNKRCRTCNQQGHVAYDCKLNKDKTKCSTCGYVGGHTANKCKYLPNPAFQSNTINNNNNNNNNKHAANASLMAAHAAPSSALGAIDPYHSPNFYEF